MLGKTHWSTAGVIGYGAFSAYLIQHHDSQDPAVNLNIGGVTITPDIDIWTYLAIMLSGVFATMFFWHVKPPWLQWLSLGLTVIMVTLSGLVGFYPNAMNIAVMLIVFMIGAISPDIDSRRSLIGRYVPFVEDILGHRTITHTLWVVGVLIAINIFFPGPFIFAFTAGYILHLIEDGWSKQGIIWFYPLTGQYKTYSSGASIKTGKRLAFQTYSTGGTFETIVFVLSLVVWAGSSGWTIWTLW